MSAEYLGTTISDHDLTLTINGDVESLGPRLVEAVQKIGYTILGEQPLYAKRRAQGGARWDCSFETLDYPTRLTINLKQINDIAVVATFNYEIKSYTNLTKGDRQTLLREAEAIAALASERLSISACPACATPVTDDSHFCRRCGAPLAVDVAEVEVLRLTRKSRTAYHNLVLGVITALIAGLIMLPLIWVDDAKAFKAFLVFGSLFAAFAAIALIQGIWQLHYALNPEDAKETKALPAAPLANSFASPSRGRASITEGTTELLVPNLPANDRRTLEPLLRKSHDTSEVKDDEPLM